MLAGHYAAAFALKAARPVVPLWALFVAVQAVDIVFFVFALTGVETLRVVPGERGPLAMDLVRIPYTHSLSLNLAYAAIVVGIASRRPGRAGMALGAALLSHWVFDFFVHLHDLPLTAAGADRVGLGLWRRPLLALALEIGLVLLAYVTLRRQLPAPAQRAGDLTAAVLVAMQLFYVFGSSPATVLEMAITAEALYVVMAVLAHRVDRRAGSASL
jgi:hypothetical protein